MRYVDWDALREELFFTESEERAITKRAFELTSNHELAQQIAQAVAGVDSKQWGLPLPNPDHPMWHVYLAYGEAVLKLLQGERDVTHEELSWPQPRKAEEQPPDASTDEELNAVFEEVGKETCAEGNHLFCRPGCTGPDEVRAL